jgi:hypothetical protein
MYTKLLAATALAGSLLLLPLLQGSAQSAALPSVPSHQSDLTLVAHEGGGGGGGGGGPHAIGGARPHAMGGNEPHGMGNGPHMRGGNFAQGDVRESRRGHGDFADHNGRDSGRFAERDRDFDHHHGHAHRVFRNGVWVWVYGPDYYYAGDCGWLLRRARVTGSPYWWSRYDACVGYY